MVFLYQYKSVKCLQAKVVSTWARLLLYTLAKAIGIGATCICQIRVYGILPTYLALKHLIVTIVLVTTSQSKGAFVCKAPFCLICGNSLSYQWYKVQYLVLLYGKLRERAVCGYFCVLIGYPSGQDGAILPTGDCPFRSRK